MKVTNTLGSYGFLAGLLVLLLGLAANASCAHASPTQDVELTPTRTPSQRADSAVEVYTECGSGSGVLIDGARVLTAYHVVSCEGPLGEMPAEWIVIRTRAKKTSVALIDVGDPGRDLARLKLKTPIDGVTPVRVRMSKVDEIICAATAVPERSFRCGIVSDFEGPRVWGDVVVANANVWYGNSGSGVYAEDGSLVGITVRLNWCSPGDALLVALIDIRVDTCGGRVSSISDSPVMP